MKKQWMKSLCLIMGVTTYLSATVYEDSENGNVDKWQVYDNTPAGATIMNVVDAEKGNVIEFLGDGSENGYRIGNFHGRVNAWNNSSEKTLKWSMKYNESFTIFVSLNTTKGHRYLIYAPTDYSGSWGYGLGTEAIDGTWRSYSRDLEADLKGIDAENSIVSVDGLFIRGSGFVDDIALVNSKGAKNPANWRVYDNSPEGASIEAVVDSEKGNVVQLIGEGEENGFALGGTNGTDFAWNETTNRQLKWSMKYDESFTIFVSLNTTKGHRYLIYAPTDYSGNWGYGLGTEARDGTWRSYSRDLETDLKGIDAENSIISVDGFFIRGSGLIDDVVLTKSPPSKPILINLLADKNWNINGVDGFSGVENHEYNSEETHSSDGSGSIKLVGHWYTKQFTTASFTLEKGKHYTLGAYMKAIGSDQGQNIMFKISGAGHSDEMNWNVSKAGQWEEIVMPYRADVTGTYTVSIFTYRYALTTDKKYAKVDGSNLDRNASIFFDDFYVYESGKIVSNEPYTPKTPYESSHVRIDKLGNWSIKENGVWKDFFPKFAYQDYTPSIIESAKMYSSYGFTGFTNMNNVGRIHLAVENGMKYNGIQVNDMRVDDVNDSIKKTIEDVNTEVSEGKLPATSVVMYEYDNEQEQLTDYKHKGLVADWLDEHDKDSLTNRRTRPINMLNGVAEGVTRNYRNSTNKNALDIVSTYIAQIGHTPNQHLNPINTLGILQKTQNQIAPVSIMQLQCHYQDVFIPSIFKGIAAGAKGLNFWRAGQGVPSVCQENFEENVWVPAIKDVFTKIDTMLPIIKEPLETSWSATVDNPTLVSIGTRDHAGKHYIILANFDYNDLLVEINLKNLQATKVKEFFSQEELTTVSADGNFSVTMGHHNRGFLILELE